MRLLSAILFAFATPALADDIAPFHIADFDGFDIIIVGEIHDDPTHHQMQADIIQAIASTAVVFEMLTEAQASRATAESIASPDLAELLEWDASGWPDFEMYAPIFAAMDRAKVVGAAASDAEAAKSRDDTIAAFGEGADKFGLTTALPEAEQMLREAEMQTGHCNALPDAMLPWFVAQQRFRDAIFARTALEALDEFGGPVVVITGNGHARSDWGMPVYLNAASPDVKVLSIGQITENDPDRPYDLWRITAPVDRPDPCAAFE